MRSDESWITSSYEKPSTVLYTNMLIHNANIMLIIFLCLYKICGVHSASWVQLRNYLEEKVAAPV
jgi:hypothetical protein